MISRRKDKFKINNIDFEKDNPQKTIFKMAIPITISQFVNLLYSIVDRIYLGHLGEESVPILAGIGLAFPMILIITAFSNMYGIGGGALFSIELGKKDREKSEKILNNTFCMLLITAVLIMFFIYIFKGAMLHAFGANGKSYVCANEYISIYLVGTIFVMISLGMNPFLNNQGYPQYGMITILIGAFINILLDPLFIFVLGLKLKGAAIATVIAQFCSSFWITYLLRSNKVKIGIRLRAMKLDVKLIKSIISLGLSSFVMSFTNAVVQVLYNFSLSGYGQESLLTIMAIINSTREIVETPRAGITDGAKPMIGHAYGAAKIDKLKDTVKIMSILCTIYCVLIWIIIMIAPQLFIRLFSSNQDILENGVIATRIYFAGIFLMSLQHCGQSFFVGIGKTREAIFFSLFRKIIIVFPLVLLLPHILNYGWKSVFIAEPISNLIGGVFCFGTMLYNLKKLKE